MKFERQDPPRKYKHWRFYRPYTREDFQHICAYCFRHEEEAGGEEQFVQDHFEPRSVNPARANDYLNLYWCCVGCNLPQNKGRVWPSPEQASNGEIFCDPCHHDPFGTDYEEAAEGTMDPLSPAGRFTIRHIGLNRRPAVVRQRLARSRVRHTYQRRLASLRTALDHWESVLQVEPSQEGASLRDLAVELVELYEEFVGREPFMIVGIPPEAPDELFEGD